MASSLLFAQRRLALRTAQGARRCASQLDALNQELADVFGSALQRDEPAAAATQQAPAAAPAAAPPPGAATLTHVDSEGRAGMVDVGGKAHTRRTAAASARVLLGRDAFQQVAENRVKKGDVLVVAQLAGINAAKLTAQLIPLCHSLNLSWVNVRLTLDHEREAVIIHTEAETVGPTGVEMEALTAAAVAGLTVYDMVKAVTKDARLTDVQLEAKAGGRSGAYARTPGASIT